MISALLLRCRAAPGRRASGALLFGGGRRNRRLGDELMRCAEIAKEARAAALRESHSYVFNAGNL
jgi:hypothetical protein